MAFQTDLQRLVDSDLVDNRERKQLIAAGISTVEELFFAIKSSTESVALILEMSEAEVAVLGERAEERLDAETKAVMNEPIRKYPLGALPPGARDYK